MPERKARGPVLSKSGTYAYRDGKLVKISDRVPSLDRECFFNKGGVPYFDRSANRRFESKAEKRQWLKENKLREGGIYNLKEVGIDPAKAPKEQ